jgi:hypothetical protein
MAVSGVVGYGRGRQRRRHHGCARRIRSCSPAKTAPSPQTDPELPVEPANRPHARHDRGSHDQYDRRQRSGGCATTEMQFRLTAVDRMATSIPPPGCAYNRVSIPIASCNTRNVPKLRVVAGTGNPRRERSR